MRWFWIDRFTEFVSGKHACSIKNVSLSEEVVDEYTPGRPSYPSAMIVEGMAQTGGILVGQMSDFQNRVVLAKVSKAIFHFEAQPGDCLKLDCRLHNVDRNGAISKGTVHVGERLQAEIDLVFGILNDERFDNVELFEPAEFCRMIRILKTFEVGVNEDGSPIQVPEHMRAAEKALLLN